MTCSASKTHSRFAPSAAKRWILCSGSVTLEAQRPDEGSNVYAQWGSAAHLLSEMRLKRVLTARALSQTIGKRIREIAPRLDPKENDFLDTVIDEEMLWVVQEYVIFCESLLPRATRTLDESVKIEIRVHTDIDPEISGTVDFAFSDWPMTLHIVDLKAGAGVQVDAVDNPQLAIYALGALDRFGRDFETVKMHIFQPRGKGETVRTWEVPTSEFYDHWRAKIENAYYRALSETNTYTTGPHCTWCKGAIVCPKVEKTYTSITRAADTLAAPKDPAKLAKILNAEVLVLEYFNQCKKEAFNLVQRGVEVPGFKLVETWGREKWANERLVHRKLAEQIDTVQLDKVTNYGLKTPKQIRRILKDEYPESLDKYTMIPNNGLCLVSAEDKRPAFKSGLEVFND